MTPTMTSGGGDRPADLIAASGITAHDAAVDPLTGLIAGPAARRLLDWRLARHPGPGRAYAVTVIDVNGLKEANDAGGHHAGDTLLAGLARLLHANVRDADLFRVGGDEFLIVHTVRRLHAANDAHVIQDRLRRLVGVLAAVGTAPWAGDSDTTVAAADRAMYAHKHAQRGAGR